MRETDEVLLEKARSGDQDAFLRLYQRYRNRMFSFLYRFLGSTDVAEDIAHDCFIGLIMRPDDSQSTVAVRTRLYSTARSLAMKYVRNHLQGSAVKGSARQHLIDRSKMRNEDTLPGTSASEVANAIAALPPLEREALILSEYEGLEVDEIATIVGSDGATVEARIGSARKRLRGNLENQLLRKS